MLQSMIDATTSLDCLASLADMTLAEQQERLKWITSIEH
jgi:hypothetical protein